ncbi:DMT family transporter [Spirillospora sp. NBC_01491]|uniref:DMT family transporter n=1 Tax=Spirillospora sp. NBC_01491 TaxID=2976007 RepID=UPI002E32D497|nr:multidrug resistance efflux transporter family protein [Spirillospora sp. NBC_01491]
MSDSATADARTGRASGTRAAGGDGSGGAGGATVAIGLAVLGALFFSVSFIANRIMAVDGGAWEWSASLRFLYSLPIFLAIVAARRGVRPVLRALRANPGPWVLWSTVGFGLFYAPICLAADLAPGWTVAATWQVTIVCGVLLAPLLYDDDRGRIPVQGLVLSGLILAGVFLTQFGHGGLSWEMAGGIAVVLVAAIAYPVGNRRTMELAVAEPAGTAAEGGEPEGTGPAGAGLDTFQRLLAMSLASLPFWLLVALAGGLRAGPPSGGQLATTALVAVCSGVIATSLFFAATHRVRRHPLRLAAVEATQAAEVAFVALAEPVIASSAPPGAWAWTGILAICAGVVLYAFAGRGGGAPDASREASPDVSRERDPARR